jgi:hypothetical protein
MTQLKPEDIWGLLATVTVILTFHPNSYVAASSFLFGCLIIVVKFDV